MKKLNKVNTFIQILAVVILFIFVGIFIYHATRGYIDTYFYSSFIVFILVWWAWNAIFCSLNNIL